MRFKILIVIIRRQIHKTVTDHLNNTSIFLWQKRMEKCHEQYY